MILSSSVELSSLLSSPFTLSLSRHCLRLGDGVERVEQYEAYSAIEIEDDGADKKG